MTKTPSPTINLLSRPMLGPGAQASAYLEGSIKAEALELAQEEHRRSSALQIDDTFRRG